MTKERTMEDDARLFLNEEAYQYVENGDALQNAAAWMGNDLPALLVAYYSWQVRVAAIP